MMPDVPFRSDDYEEKRVAALRSYDILDTPPEEAFDSIARIVASFIDVPIALISLVDETRQWFKSHYGLDVTETPRAESFCTHTLARDSVMVVEDAHEDPRFAGTPLVIGDPHIRFYAGAPLQTSTGFNLGTLCVIDRTPRVLTAEQQQLLVDLAAIVVAQIELRLTVKKAAAAIQQQEQQNDIIRDRELRLAGIFDAAADVIINVNSNGVIESCNPAVEKLFGYTPDELYGKNIRLLTGDNDLQGVDDYLYYSHEERMPTVKALSRDGHGKRKDGSEFPVEISISAVNLDDGRLYTGIVRDLTERRRVEKERVDATAHAEKANLAKSDFLSRMSHELRTPLNAIVGFCDLLLTDERDPEHQEYLEQIMAAGDHLTSLINEVLDISRIEAGKQTLVLEAVRVNEVITECCHLMLPLASERNLICSINEGIDDDPIAVADRQRLKQVLLNLFSNAIKYNCDGGSIDVTCRNVESGMMRVSVTDTGPGIDAADRNQVFELFQRLPGTSPDVEGSGVGLALSKGLVELMHGRLDFVSERGKGSTFWIDLPQGERLSEINNAADSGIGAGTVIRRDGSRPYELLYIEDNLPNIRLVEAALEKYGHFKMTTAMLGKLGIDMAIDLRPDLVLLDVHLPDIMGTEVLTALKNNPATRNVPVIAVSADASGEQKKKMLEHGAVAYVTKPINVRSFLQTVATVLQDANHEG